MSLDRPTGINVEKGAVLHYGRFNTVKARECVIGLSGLAKVGNSAADYQAWRSSKYTPRRLRQREQ